MLLRNFRLQHCRHTPHKHLFCSGAITPGDTDRARKQPLTAPAPQPQVYDCRSGMCT